jgi:hypothetical protein
VKDEDDGWETQGNKDVVWWRREAFCSGGSEAEARCAVTEDVVTSWRVN